MRVVVTRPEIAGRQTAERLRNLGHEPVLLPLSKPIHDPQAARQALAKNHWALAITSAEATRVLASLGADLDPHRRTLLFAVGAGSAKAAGDAGFTNVVASKGDGAELADRIHDHAGAGKSPGKPLLYLAGRPRASGFEARLSALGLPFTICESYGMEKVSWEDAALTELLSSGPVDAVLFYSAQTAAQFFAHPVFHAHPDLLAATRFLCLSDKIARALPELYHTNIAIAACPDEDHLLALL